jgi:hypothetical protein
MKQKTCKSISVEEEILISNKRKRSEEHDSFVVTLTKPRTDLSIPSLSDPNSRMPLAG